MTTSPTKEYAPEPTSSDEHAVPTGLLAGRYKAINVLGRGAMGDVYLARHVRAGRVVALKVVSSAFASDHRICERVRAEAQACSAARHPNIVEVFDAGELEDGRPYVAMEYLEGRRLLDLFEAEGPLPIARACRMMLEVARAIAAAHKVGIIHRDLKAENVMLVQRDGVEVVKVLDFGIAAAVAREGGRATMPGIGIGTPEYMAPEQVYGADPTPRFDVYALGVLMYEALTGTLPFSGDQPSVILQRKATTPAPPITDQRAEIPGPLAKLIDQCLALDPDDRPATADEIARVLESYVDAAPVPMTAAAPETRRRNSGLLVTIGVAAVAAIVAVIAMRPAALKTAVPTLARLAWVTDDGLKIPDAPATPTPPPAEPEPEIIAPPVEPPPVELAKADVPTAKGKKPRKDPALPSVGADPPKPPAEAKPTPAEVFASDDCVRMRARVDDARAHHDWDIVLGATKKGECWKTNRDRVAMRVKANLELKRWAECKHAAGSINDKEIQRDAKICEMRMTDEEK